MINKCYQEDGYFVNITCKVNPSHYSFGEIRNTFKNGIGELYNWWINWDPNSTFTSLPLDIPDDAVGSTLLSVVQLLFTHGTVSTVMAAIVNVCPSHTKPLWMRISVKTTQFWSYRSCPSSLSKYLLLI